MSSIFTFLLVLALAYAARDQQPEDRAKKPKPKPNKPKPKPTTTTKPQPEHFNPLPSDARQECYDCLAALASVCGRHCFTGDNDIECFSCVFEHNPDCLPACGFPAASTQFCSEPNFCPKSGGPGSGSCQEPVTGESPVPVLPTTTGAPGSNGTGGTEAAPIRPNGCTVDWGINYNGNDLRHQRAKDWVQCVDLCDQLEQCTVWTYRQDTEICFLKTSNSGREGKSDHISGTKECAGGTVAAPIRPNGCTVEWGFDYADIDGNIPGHRGYAVKDMEQCMDDCAALEQCNDWTFHPSSSNCWLKTSSSGRKAADYAISGAKMCGASVEG